MSDYNLVKFHGTSRYNEVDYDGFIILTEIECDEYMETILQIEGIMEVNKFNFYYMPNHMDNIVIYSKKDLDKAFDIISLDIQEKNFLINYLCNGTNKFGTCPTLLELKEIQEKLEAAALNDPLKI